MTSVHEVQFVENMLIVEIQLVATAVSVISATMEILTFAVSLQNILILRAFTEDRN